MSDRHRTIASSHAPNRVQGMRANVPVAEAVMFLADAELGRIFKN
jgi:hypothetical protein